MSGRGNRYDNAAIEGFFQTLKTESTHHRRHQTHAEARAEAFDYLEVFYNRQRQHSRLGYKSPAEFEVELPDRLLVCPTGQDHTKLNLLSRPGMQAFATSWVREAFVRWEDSP
jgi:hypothetical protein